MTCTSNGEVWCCDVAVY